jgi:hypothetical protein
VHAAWSAEQVKVKRKMRGLKRESSGKRSLATPSPNVLLMDKLAMVSPEPIISQTDFLLGITKTPFNTPAVVKAQASEKKQLVKAASEIASVQTKFSPQQQVATTSGENKKPPLVVSSRFLKENAPTTAVPTSQETVAGNVPGDISRTTSDVSSLQEIVVVVDVSSPSEFSTDDNNYDAYDAEVAAITQRAHEGNVKEHRATHPPRGCNANEASVGKAALRDVMYASDFSSTFPNLNVASTTSP